MKDKTKAKNIPEAGSGILRLVANAIHPVFAIVSILVLLEVGF